MEKKERDFVWLKKKDYLKQSVLLKILYYIGMYRFLDCTKCVNHQIRYISPDKKQMHSNGRYVSFLSVRWWYPLAWIFIIILTVFVFFIQGFRGLKYMFKDNCKELRIEEHIYKILYDIKGKRVY